MLLTLRAQPDIDQSTLGEETGIDLATLAPLVYRMEQRNLLTRRIDPDNRRRKLLTLTEEGLRTLQRIAPLSEAVEKDVLSGLSVQQHKDLLHALRWISSPNHGDH